MPSYASMRIQNQFVCYSRKIVEPLRVLVAIGNNELSALLE